VVLATMDIGLWPMGRWL